MLATVSDAGPPLRQHWANVQRPFMWNEENLLIDFCLANNTHVHREEHNSWMQMYLIYLECVFFTKKQQLTDSKIQILWAQFSESRFYLYYIYARIYIYIYRFIIQLCLLFCNKFVITCGQHKIESKIEKKAVGNVDIQTDGYAVWVLIVRTSGSFLLFLSGLWVNLSHHGTFLLLLITVLITSQ